MIDPRRPALVAAIYLGTFIAVLNVSSVSVALPALQTAFRTDMAGLQWVIDAYALCVSAFMLSAGPIGDHYGRKLSWLAGVAAFTLGALVCAAASSLAVLLAGRVVQGIAGALLIPGALSILTQAFPDPRERAHVIGGWSSFSALSLVIGPILGGFLLETVGWPSIFLVNVPLGVGALLLGAYGIRESADPDHAAFDPAGQVLSVFWLGALTYGLIAAGERGWTAAHAMVALALAGLGLLVFLAVESRAARPILPLGLFRNAGFAAANFASFVLGLSAYSSVFFFSIFLQQAQGWSAAATGWRMAPQSLAMIAASLVFGSLAARLGDRRVMIAGYAMIGVAMATMALVAADAPYLHAAIPFVVLGLGMGLSIPATSTVLMASIPRAQSGMASAIMNALRQTGMTVGIALLGTVMSARATALLEAGLGEAGVVDAAGAARAAVTRHELPADAAVGADVFRGLLADAFAGGFHAAMVCAGLAGILAALVLAAVRPHPAA